MRYPYDGSPAGNERIIMDARGPGPNGIPLSMESDAVILAERNAHKAISLLQDAEDEVSEKISRTFSKARRLLQSTP